MISIDEKYCKGCGYCILACPTDALSKADSLNVCGIPVPKIKEESCKKCRLCELACPDFAISVED